MAKGFFRQGAEAQLAEITLDGEECISKKRIPKAYRGQKLDILLRKKRTRAEAKLLREAAKIVNAPKIISVDKKNAEIIMEFIKGKTLKSVLERNTPLCAQAGEKIRALHDGGIIHGDLTTSNIIFVQSNGDFGEKNRELHERVRKKGNLFFIDFGLGFFSKKLEDRAADLVVFKKTFAATHSSIKNGWELVMKGYSPSNELVQRMNAIEKRARYH